MDMDIAIVFADENGVERYVECPFCREITELGVAQVHSLDWVDRTTITCYECGYKFIIEKNE